MDLAALDTAYDNRGAVADSAARVARWTNRTREIRALYPEHLDLAYGHRPRNRIDLYRSAAPDAPLLAFIHGGYWQRNSKDVFGCLAEGPLAHGIDVAMIGYTLCPEIRLSGIVDEIVGALDWLAEHAPARGFPVRRLAVSGWSAGGHLTALAMSHRRVDAGLAISGIYELEPIRLGSLNQAVQLDPDEVDRLSPIRQLPRAAGPLTVTYGEGELPELQRQSREFFAAWHAAGLPGAARPDPRSRSLQHSRRAPPTRRRVDRRRVPAARPTARGVALIRGAHIYQQRRTTMIGMLDPRRRRFGVVATASALTLLVGVATAAAQKAEPCLGASLEVTGAISHMGLAVRIGVETALDEINEKGGVLGQKLKWVYYDDQADPAKAVDNARRIGEKDNCVAMIGGFRTPNAMAIRQPIAEMGMPWVGVMSAGTKVVEWDKNDNKWMFRVSMKDRWVGPYLAENALKRSAAKVGLLYEATA